MFADPLSITINGVALSLVKINQDGYSSEYRLLTNLADTTLTIRNSKYPDKKRGNVMINRHTVQLTQTVFPVAPATTSTLRKAYAVIENQEGDTLTDPKYIASGLFGFLTGANIDKLMSFES